MTLIDEIAEKHGKVELPAHRGDVLNIEHHIRQALNEYAQRSAAKVEPVAWIGTRLSPEGLLNHRTVALGRQFLKDHYYHDSEITPLYAHPPAEGMEPSISDILQAIARGWSLREGLAKANERAESAERQLAAEREKVASLTEDAERYRWIRSHYVASGAEQYKLQWYLPRFHPLNAEGLDQSLDAARKETP